jgi:hypothetical protein
MLALNHTLLEREYSLMKAVKALASIVSICKFPRHFLIGDYTQIFYTLYKWNVVSIQYKKRLRRCPSMRGLECLVPVCQSRPGVQTRCL